VVKDTKQQMFTQMLVSDVRDETVNIQSVYALGSTSSLKRTLLSKYLEPPNVFENWKQDTYE
jgi:hypothetical protein